jgi:hypothetical protein
VKTLFVSQLTTIREPNLDNATDVQAKNRAWKEKELARDVEKRENKNPQAKKKRAVKHLEDEMDLIATNVETTKRSRNIEPSGDFQRELITELKLLNNNLEGLKQVMAETIKETNLKALEKFSHITEIILAHDLEMCKK